MSDFSLIAAVALNGVIGDSKSNTMPWHLPGDLEYFKDMTYGQTIVMGSRTFESLGKPLKGRRNVVITSSLDKAFRYKQVVGADEVYASFDDVLAQEAPGFIVIGGGQVYAEAIKHAPNDLFITIVCLNPEGDVKFPVEGVRFLGKYVFTDGHSWHRKFALPRRTENGIEYQVTGFGLDSP